MAVYRMFVSGLLALSFTAASAGPLGDIPIDTLSFSYGRGQGDADIYRIGAQSAWDRTWLNEGDWHVTGYWNAEAGHWHSDKTGGHEDNVFELALTPILRLQQKNSHSGQFAPYVEAGIGLHLIGPTSIGDRSLSSAFQIGSHFGAGFLFGEGGKYDLGYRYQHLSNGGLNHPNNGLDIHTFNIGMRY